MRLFGSFVSQAAAALLVAAPVALAEPPADTTAGRAEPLPDELEGIGITERLDTRLPLEAAFVDENGEAVLLGDYFGERPVLLNLGYYTCPMLCGLVLNAVLEGLKELEWTAGEEFTIVTASIDPTETATLAKLKKQNAIKDYGRPGAATGWHFLTGDEKNIRALADSVGFAYRYDEETAQYAHAAGIFICTPDGRLSRVLYGVIYDPETLRLSLVEASDGKIGSPLDRILLYCYHYDATRGKYAPAAMNIMRGGGILAAVAFGIALVVLWRRDASRGRKA